MSGRRPAPTGKKSIAGKRRRDSETDSEEEDRDTKRPRVDEDADFVPTGRTEATSNLGNIETRAQHLAREQQETAGSNMELDEDLGDAEPNMELDEDLGDAELNMEPDDDPSDDDPSDDEPQAESPEANPPEIGEGQPLVHPDPTKFPKKYMVNTGVNGVPKFPIDDEVYEIRDYLVRYKDFNFRAPSVNRQLIQANDNELTDQLKNLLKLQTRQLACLECSRWFNPSDDRCNERCYYAFRGYMFDWAEENISIHKTPGERQGYGAYLLPKAGKVAKNDYLGIYYGVIVGPKNDRNGEHIPGSDYVFAMDDGEDGENNFNIDSAMYGNWTRFSNSHCNPNTEVRLEQIGGIRVLAFRALRPIDEKEEIVINYGKPYFMDRNPPLLCTCTYLPYPHEPRGHTQSRKQQTYPAAAKSEPKIKSSPEQSSSSIKSSAEKSSSSIKSSPKKSSPSIKSSPKKSSPSMKSSPKKSSPSVKSSPKTSSSSIKSSPKTSPSRQEEELNLEQLVDRILEQGNLEDYLPIVATKNPSRSFLRAYGYVGNVRGAINGQEMIEVADNDTPMSSSSSSYVVEDSDVEMEEPEPDEIE